VLLSESRHVVSTCLGRGNRPQNDEERRQSACLSAVVHRDFSSQTRVSVNKVMF